MLNDCLKVHCRQLSSQSHLLAHCGVYITANDNQTIMDPRAMYLVLQLASSVKTKLLSKD